MAICSEDVLGYGERGRVTLRVNVKRSREPGSFLFLNKCVAEKSWWGPGGDAPGEGKATRLGTLCSSEELQTLPSLPSWVWLGGRYQWYSLGVSLL